MDLLPQELLHIILNNVETSEDLRSYTLVGRAWYTPSQARLFNNIALGSKRNSSLLHAHLKCWPYIIPSIHQLSVDVALRFTFDPLAPRNVSDVQLLQLLAHLQSLSIYCNYCGITGYFRDGFVQHHSLLCLTLYNCVTDITGLHSLLLHATSLKRLSLLGVSILTSSLDPSLIPLRARIEELAISPDLMDNLNGPSILTEWLQSAVNLTHLRALHIGGCDYTNRNPPQHILRFTGNTLTRFSFRSFRNCSSIPLSLPAIWDFLSVPPVSEVWQDEELPVEFSKSVSLTSLAFFFPVDTLEITSAGPPRWLMAALATLPLTARIEELEICFYIIARDFPDVSNQIRRLNYYPWRCLASVLTSQPFFALRSVTVMLAYNTARDIRPDLMVLRDMVEREMLGLGTRLHFVIEGWRKRLENNLPWP